MMSPALRTRRFSIPLLTLLLAAMLPTSQPRVSVAQEVPDEVQRELQRRGMTAEEARQQAARMGIDLDNPAQEPFPNR